MVACASCSVALTSTTPRLLTSRRLLLHSTPSLTTTTNPYPKPIHFSLINRFHRYRILNAIEKNQEQNQEIEEQTLDSPPNVPIPPIPITELNEKSIESSKENLWSGVAEEIKEIEWPGFGKVLGITGVVLGVIAGSSLVLLTVNAILAELSDRVFVGRGVQDFFG